MKCTPYRQFVVHFLSFICPLLRINRLKMIVENLIISWLEPHCYAVLGIFTGWAVRFVAEFNSPRLHQIRKRRTLFCQEWVCASVQNLRTTDFVSIFCKNHLSFVRKVVFCVEWLGWEIIIYFFSLYQIPIVALHLYFSKYIYWGLTKPHFWFLLFMRE